MTATIPANYGNGGPFYAPSRSLDADSALLFVKGERVATPVLVGDRASWSMCAWVYAEPEARTLFYERDAAKENVAHLIQVSLLSGCSRQVVLEWSNSETPRAARAT